MTEPTFMREYTGVWLDHTPEELVQAKAEWEANQRRHRASRGVRKTKGSKA